MLLFLGVDQLFSSLRSDSSQGYRQGILEAIKS